MAGSQGVGSALILRAKEARLRAQTADAMGLSTPLPSGQPGTSVSAIQSTQGSPVPPIMPGQPIQPPNQEPSPDDAMYGHVEQFLQSLGQKFDFPYVAGPVANPVVAPPPVEAPPAAPGPRARTPAPLLGGQAPTAAAMLNERPQLSDAGANRELFG